MRQNKRGRHWLWVNVNLSPPLNYWNLNIQLAWEHWPKPWRPNWLSLPSFSVVGWCCILTWEDVGAQVFTLCVFFSPVVDLVSRPFPICSRMSPRAPRIQNDNFVRPGHQPSLDRQRKLKNLKINLSDEVKLNEFSFCQELKSDPPNV